MAPGSNLHSTIQMLQVPVIHFAYCHDPKKKKKKSKEMEHMEHGTSNLKNAIVLLHIREAYIIAIDVAK